MLERSLAYFCIIFLLTTGALAEANELCSESTKEEDCSALSFESGLPSKSYRATILSISKIIEDDFRHYLTESHGPFSEGKTPPIDYEVSFISAQYESKVYGITNFVVVSTATKIKPFGIIVIKSTGEVQEIDVSYGYSSYAILERDDGMYFLHKDRFSQNTSFIKIYGK